MQLNLRNGFQNIIITTENITNYIPVLPSRLWKLQKIITYMTKKIGLFLHFMCSSPNELEFILQKVKEKKNLQT